MVDELSEVRSPLLDMRGGAQRRGGCSRDSLEQPPRLRWIKGASRYFLWRAATPPVQEERSHLSGSSLVIATIVLLTLAAAALPAQDIRERIRLRPRGTRVSQAQAADVTLTVSPVVVRPIQQIVRTGGTIDASHKVVTATVNGPAASLIKPGLRARAFPPESKSSMYQARVTGVNLRDGTAVVAASLSSVGVEGRLNYVLEITVERGEFLSVPNEAIIEEGDRRVVYVQQGEGNYVPKTIETGLQGELYTQVVGGLEGGEQVVTFGSFFIDSEYKLKFAEAPTGP